MVRRNDRLSLVVFGAYLVVSSAMFVSSGGSELTLAVGVNVGVGLTGPALSALEVIRPGRYRFLYGGAAGEDSSSQVRRARRIEVAGAGSPNPRGSGARPTSEPVPRDD